MSPVIYWILFCLLVSLLVIFVSCLVFNIILDNCLSNPEEGQSKMGHMDEAEEERRLNKYHFDKHHVEDLTRIQGDLKTVLPNISLTNEVHNTDVERLLQRKDINRHHDLNSSLSDINEENAFRDSIDDVYDSIVSKQSTTIKQNGGNIFKTQKGISQSVDDLEFCDPHGIDVLKEIHLIKDKAVEVEKELDYFVGGPNDVKFYELNERFLKLMIVLCDMPCDSDDLRKKKAEALEYIEGCQRKLKEKAKSVL